MNPDGSTTPWFHVGLIAAPGYDPPDLDRRVARNLMKLTGPKSRTHRIGLYGVWAEPVSGAACAAAEGWSHAGYAVDRSGGRRAWLRVWSMIAAAACDALVVFGPTDPTIETSSGCAGRWGARSGGSNSRRNGWPKLSCWRFLDNAGSTYS